jgi:tRNA G18 (ribose-2'-O)-methylase SpoU
MISAKNTTYLLLDNVRSVHNVGSIFRTAECAGVSKIICVGTTPVPVDRFGRKRNDFAKVALGAEDLVDWEHVESNKTVGTIKRLIKRGFQIVAVEQAKGAVDYSKMKNNDRVKGNKAGRKSVFIFGNEVDGVSPKLIKSADSIVEIPMRGKKESLNVSVAVGIILFAH